MKFSDKVKGFLSSKTALAVAALMVLILIAIANDADAQEFNIEAGQLINNLEVAPTILADARWLDMGPGDSDIAVGAYLLGESEFDGMNTSRQMGAYAQLVDHIGNIEVGFGLTYQKNDEFVVSDPFRFTLLLGLRFDNDIWFVPDSVSIRHNSNGGSGDLNSGWDWVSFSWRVR